MTATGNSVASANPHGRLGLTVPVMAAALGFAGAALALMGTERFGVGSGSDALAYISAAEGLLAGRGFVLFNGQPYLGWPPLYPLAISALAAAGTDAAHAARLLNAGLFGLIVSITVLWAGRLGLPRPAVAWAGVAVLVGVPMFDLWRLAHSELLFILLVLAFAWLLARWQATGTLLHLGMASVAAGAACLTRYAGVAAIMTGCLVVLLDRRYSVARRVPLSAGFGVVAVLINVPWAIRNAMVMGAPTGAHQSASPFTVPALLSMTFDVVGRWVAPPRIPILLPRGIALALLAVVFLTFLWSLRRRSAESSDSRRAMLFVSVRVLSAWVIVYTAFLVAVRSLTFIDSDHGRLLSPVYVPAVLVVCWLGSEITRRVHGHRGRIARAAAWAIAALSLLWPLRYTIGATNRVIQNGAGGYATNRWQLSPTLSYLKRERIEGNIYSNEPNALHVVAGLDSAFPLPEHDHPLAPISADSALRSFRAARRADSVWVVLFTNPELERNAYSSADFEQAFGATAVARFSDGVVYRVR